VYNREAEIAQVGCREMSSGNAQRPNILILMPDQMRADCMGCAGHEVIQTPNLDRLAAEGVRFDRFYTASPLCMPARASFISGRWPHNHNMWRNAGRLPRDYESMFRRLQAAGYRTAHVGKSHYYEHHGQHLRDEEPYMRARGFEDLHETTGPWATLTTDSYMTDRWADLGLLDVFRNDYRKRREHGAEIPTWPSPLPEEEYMDSYVGRVACEYLEAYDDSRPFALFVGFPGPHEPWDPPGRWAKMYDPEAMPAAIPPEEPQEWTPDYVAAALRPSYADALTPQKIAEIRARYYGKISLVDYWVGELLRVLDERGWAENTLVVFWSDHGEMAGDHGWLHKQLFYEQSVRVPLLMRWPERIDTGQVRGGLVSTVDLPPTILEVAGAEAGPNAMGVSLWAHVGDEERELRGAVFSEIAPAPLGNIMVRTKRWKYAMGNDGRAWMLYDIEADPSEQVNLVGNNEYATVEAEMRELLLEFLASAQPYVFCAVISRRLVTRPEGSSSCPLVIRGRHGPKTPRAKTWPGSAAGLPT